jgi:hypothetical protein
MRVQPREETGGKESQRAKHPSLEQDEQMGEVACCGTTNRRLLRQSGTRARKNRQRFLTEETRRRAESQANAQQLRRSEPRVLELARRKEELWERPQRQPIAAASHRASLSAREWRHGVPSRQAPMGQGTAQPLGALPSGEGSHLRSMPQLPSPGLARALGPPTSPTDRLRPGRQSPHDRLQT